MKDRFSYKFYYHILRRAISQTIRPGRRVKRSESFVKEEYTGNYGTETNYDFMYKRQDVFLDGRKALYPVIEYKKVMMRMFADKLSSFAPDSLLELGSGRGFNILTLAILCPSIRRIRGVELSPKGVLQAKENLKNPPVDILRHLTGLSPEEIRKRLAGRDIDFVEGSIRELPFKDGEFDAIYSNSVIEQIPNDYYKVFAEASRVAAKVGIFSEPFFEAQRYHPFKLLHLKNIDYFRASFWEVEKCGWKVFQYETPNLQKYVFATGMLTAVKKLPGA